MFIYSDINIVSRQSERALYVDYFINLNTVSFASDVYVYIILSDRVTHLKDVRAKIFERSEFVKTFVRVRLWEPFARNAKKIGGHLACEQALLRGGGRGRGVGPRPPPRKRACSQARGHLTRFGDKLCSRQC